MLGHLDSAVGSLVQGWAYDEARPDVRLQVEIVVGEAIVGRVLADVFRADLEAAGIGDGRHSFTLTLDLPQTKGLRARVSGTDFFLDDGSQWRARRHAEVFTQSLMNGLPNQPFGFTKAAVDAGLANAVVREIIDAWKAGQAASQTDPGLVAANPAQRELARLLEAGRPEDVLTFIQCCPKSDITYGFLQGELAYHHLTITTDVGRGQAAGLHVDALLALAQSLGLLSSEAPEQAEPGRNLVSTDPASLVADLEAKAGFDLAPPAIFDGLFGALLKGAVYNRRHIQAIDAALALRTAPIELPAASVCEIGAGVGFLALYAVRLGVRRYTIVDLPTICLIQFYALKCSFPDKRISLGADPLANVQILTSDQFKLASERFDCVINVDLFAELHADVRADYLDMIAARSRYFLSINPEIAGPGDQRITIAADLDSHPGFGRVYRFRNWVRRGYVQELYRTVM